MIYMFNSLAEAHASTIKGKLGVNTDGTAYIETDDRPIEEIRRIKLEQLKEYRDNLYSFGGYGVGDMWFYSSDTAKIAQIGLLLMGNAIPTGLTIPLMDGSRVSATPALAKQIFSAAASQNDSISAVAKRHKALIEAHPDPANYDISVGWPTTFTS